MAATDVTRGSVRADGNGSSVGRVARRLVTETKEAFKTTEFWAMLGLVVAILVSAAVIKGGDNGTDEFIARQAWLYVSILGAALFHLPRARQGRHAATRTPTSPPKLAREPAPASAAMSARPRAMGQQIGIVGARSAAHPSPGGTLILFRE